MTSFIDTVELSAHSATWLELLIAAALKGVVILIIALVLNLALRRASAASRHLVWSLALASLLAIPVLSFGLPSWQVPLLPGAFAVAQPESVAGEPEPLAHVASPSLPQVYESNAIVKQQARTDAPESPAPVSQPKTSEPLNWASLALTVWMAGALLILVRLLIGTAIVWWMARRAKRITDGEWAFLVERLASRVGIGRPVTLLLSNRITMPVTCGLLRSAVLLPADADDWSDARRRVVLLHELAHVKRRDCLTQMLAQVACAIYWFNPLIWRAARHLRMERERACDDQVLDAGTKASDYADHLLDLARSLRSARCSSLAAVAIARRSQLEGRLLAILDPSLSRRGLNRIASVSIGLTVALIVLPLAAIRPSARAQSKSSPDVEAARSISFDSTAQPIAPRPNSASAVIPQTTGQTENHHLEQSALASQANMASQADTARQADSAQPANLPQGEEENEQQSEQATKPGQRDNSSTIEALIEALRDEDAEVRQHAVFALTQIGGPRATQALAAALKASDPEVREKAVWGLGIKPGDDMVDLLVNALGDTHPGVRQKAAWSLGLKGDRRSVQPLINALRDENNEVRQMAAWALGLKGNSQAVEPLMDALRDKDKEARGMAAWALGLRGDRRAAKALNAALKDEDNDVRKKAAWALGMLMIRSGEADRVDNDVEGDVDMDVGSDSNRSGARAKAKARRKPE